MYFTLYLGYSLLICGVLYVLIFAITLFRGGPALPVCQALMGCNYCAKLLSNTVRLDSFIAEYCFGMVFAWCQNMIPGRPIGVRRLELASVVKN